MKKAMIFLATILLTLPLAAQHQNKAVLSTADGEQQLNTSEIQCIRFDGGRVTVVQPWGTTVFDRTLRELTFLRPLPGTVRLTVDATIGSDADQVSRRALSLGGDGKVRSTWEAGDRVYVYANNTSTESLGTLTPETTGSATSRLVGDVAVDGLTDGQTLYLSTMPRPHTFAAQTGRLEDIFFATAQSQLTIVEANASLANTTFANAQAITRFTMKDGYGNDVSVSHLVITGGAGTITVTPAAATSELYVAMPATNSQTTYSFTATAADGVRSGVKTANVQQGSYYRTNVTVKLTASVSAAPTKKTLTYTANAQQLVNAGTAVGGTMQYQYTATNSKPTSTTGFAASIPTNTNAFTTGYVWYYVLGDADHHNSAIAGTAVSVSIGKKALTITAKAQTVNYGTAITKNTNQITADGLCTGHSVTAITLSQSRTDAGSGTITPSAATVKDGNSYDVTANYNITYATGVLTINTVPASVASAPTAKSGLVYNGSAQTLVNAGTASGGTMMYAVTTTNSKPSTGYSNTLPTGTNAGTYYVWYYVAGDSNHNDTGVSSTAVSVSIGKATPTVTAPTAKTGLKYNGSGQQLINAGSTTGGTLKYSVDGGTTWYTSATDIKGTNAGTYTCLYKVDGDSNYNGVSQNSISATIGKAAATITLSSTSIEIKKGTSMEITATLSATSNTTVTVTSGNSNYVGASARAVGNNVYNINVTGNAVTSGTINVTISATSDNYTYTSKTCAVTVTRNTYMSDDYRIGYIYYSDGTYSKDRDYSKTPIGIIAYINDGSAVGDALTEKSAGYGHGLIMNTTISDIPLITTAELTTFKNLINGNSLFPEIDVEYVNDNTRMDGNGLARTTQMSREGITSAVTVDEFNRATNCSGWFIPSVGQFIAALESLVGKSFNDNSEDLLDDGDEQGEMALKIENLLKKAGGRGLPCGTYWTSSLYSWNSYAIPTFSIHTFFLCPGEEWGLQINETNSREKNNTHLVSFCAF